MTSVGTAIPGSESMIRESNCFSIPRAAFTSRAATLRRNLQTPTGYSFVLVKLSSVA